MKCEVGDTVFIKGKDGNIKVYRNQKVIYDDNDFEEQGEDWTFTPVLFLVHNDQV